MVAASELTPIRSAADLQCSFYPYPTKGQCQHDGRSAIVSSNADRLLPTHAHGSFG